MPSAVRSKSYSTVEVKPDSATPKSTLAPSSPGSPKAVHFAPAFKAASRALLPIEAWSLYHFETHCRQCTDCYNPLDAPSEGRRLCAAGYGLAQDVAEHVHRRDGAVYSRALENHKLVRVDLPEGYTQVPQLLKFMERAQRKTHRTTVPLVSYDPVPTRRSTPVDDERTKVTVEAARSKTHRTSTHKSTRHRTVVVQEDDDEVERTSTKSSAQKERRGSLYYEDLARQRKDAYEVEVRQPERRERRRDRERPLSGFWL
ncbi:hypothetical protein LTR53_005448 [Teratosphaeriaceae sp. CCFEE 6253]|nr:hypothetical protein LTR53_005448 [Teratosphaeriaceae sp. CCFEE 6253]